MLTSALAPTPGAKISLDRSWSQSTRHRNKTKQRNKAQCGSTWIEIGSPCHNRVEESDVTWCNHTPVAPVSWSSCFFFAFSVKLHRLRRMHLAHTSKRWLLRSNSAPGSVRNVAIPKCWNQRSNTGDGCGWFIIEKILEKWMTWGYPHFRKPPYHMNRLQYNAIRDNTGQHRLLKRQILSFPLHQVLFVHVLSFPTAGFSGFELPIRATVSTILWSR